ncbi:Ecdysteroid kinase-domain-containing protein [Fimicolochytrium jonesii]|uniref:Ecdysteroid kinase-domain-containing protein n=1 Tax=Fimicolochytrium jonesii TaxID=1396493 RepID=UPI0022FE81C6|nr:Ecdysteroid kinase-domain-containing protein [Fimicolochytrium jonesii]KAI8820489.1 Ecdysteroid kinase-domain-containing protein [Fimicolochytrium jonesii]
MSKRKAGSDISTRKPGQVSKLQSILPPYTKVLSTAVVASLWAGYGTISRITAQETSSKRKVSYILKTVEADRGDPKDEGHNRKVTSYKVEGTFYEKEQFAKSLKNSLVGEVPIPEPLAVRMSSGDRDGFSLGILMSDLHPVYSRSSSSLDFADACSALTWLARFHAHFWGSEPSRSPTDAKGTLSPSGIWKEGSYWHLGTRTAEFESIPRSKRWDPFRRHGGTIATMLASRMQEDEVGMRYRTVLHGDPKAENILFKAKGAAEDGGPGCAFYDFQYAGYGVSAVDVAYFLATSVHPRLLSETSEYELLTVYNTEVRRCLRLRGLHVDAEDFTLSRLQIELGWAIVDWVRFMAGWGTWGNSDWAEKKARLALSRMGMND